ncbi:MAG: type II toxin-antitoxin system VapC family toxin [Actinomycetota bacterium]
MLYLDSSAIVKLFAYEPETARLVEVIRADPEIVSSVIARVEVVRAVRLRGTGRDRLERMSEILDRIALVRMDDQIVTRAGALDPPGLRTLDALHLATALSLGQDAAAMVTYDARLAEAAAGAGLPVMSPS